MKRAKKLFLMILVIGVFVFLAIPASAKNYKCPWCHNNGSYDTYMQVTKVTYLGEEPCRLGHSHMDKLYYLNRTLHEHCSACGGYHTSSYDIYCYCCPWDSEPQVDPPPNFELE